MIAGSSCVSCAWPEVLPPLLALPSLSSRLSLSQGRMQTAFTSPTPLPLPGLQDYLWYYDTMIHQHYSHHQQALFQVITFMHHTAYMPSSLSPTLLCLLIPLVVSRLSWKNVAHFLTLILSGQARLFQLISLSPTDAVQVLPASLAYVITCLKDLFLLSP